MEQNELLKKFFLLQINDALFPIGGYSHSFGLETYIQQGSVHDADTAANYMKKRLMYNIAYSDLLAVKLAYESAEESDLKKLDDLEEKLEASRIPMELREAAYKLGSRFVKTLLPLLDGEDEGIFQKYIQLRNGRTICHSCAYGVFCAYIGIEKEEAMAHYLYAQTSAMVTNCVKSIPLSQTAGQKLLSSLYPVLREVLEVTEQSTEEMLCISTPGFDIRSIQHETLYSRIYMS